MLVAVAAAQLKRTLRDTEDGLGAQSRHVARAKNTPRE